MKALTLLFTIFLVGCAGMNPNPGERTADVAWSKYDYPRAIEILKPAAERGEPWAQLRLGVGYELGAGFEKDIPTAVSWYKKAAVQTADGQWADGLLVGAVGRSGYFNQNNDALIAQHQLAGIYYRGESVGKDLVKAFFLEKNVSDVANGNSIFYCCEFSGGRYITAKAISERLKEIEEAMSDSERSEALSKVDSWNVESGL